MPWENTNLHQVKGDGEIKEIDSGIDDHSTFGFPKVLRLVALMANSQAFGLDRRRLNSE